MNYKHIKIFHSYLIISLSLLTFLKVQNQLREDRPGHISHRESKLPRTLKPSLWGREFHPLGCPFPRDLAQKHDRQYFSRPQFGAPLRVTQIHMVSSSRFTHRC